jgi:2,5-dihydroxypyridine 5,6-dioxygenase
VIVYTDGNGRPELESSFATAAQLLGATVLELRVPPRMPAFPDGPSEWWARAPEPVIQAFSVADLIVDVSGGGLFHSSQAVILERGTRVLRAREPVGRLRALFPHPEVTAAVKASAELLAGSSEVAFSSAAGTDLVVGTADRPVTAQYGYTDQPGRWDHFGTALAALAPAEGEGNGAFVLAPGDVVFFTATIGRYVREPLRVEFRDGSIVSIEGGIEARMLQDLIDAAPTDHARRLSHLGWGLDPRAVWSGVELFGRDGGGGADVRSVAGGVVIAFGANLDLGGTSDSPVHVDLAIRDAAATVDGVDAVRDGQMVVS